MRRTPKVHYWIEDVTIADASSLRVLAAAPAEKEKRDRSLLLVGDSVAPNDDISRTAARRRRKCKALPAIFRRTKKYLRGSRRRRQRIWPAVPRSFPIFILWRTEPPAG